MPLRLTAALLALAILALPGPASAGEIKIGLLADLSGPTAEVGRPFAQGVRDAAAYCNQTGALGGDTLSIALTDVGAERHGATAAYVRLTYQEHITALISWGASVVESLSERAAEDKIPTLSASSARLWDPKTAPYNFFVSPDFTIRAMAALLYFKSSWTGDRPPRLALIYPNIPLAMDWIAAIRDFARASGYELTVEEHLDLRASDAAPQMRRLKAEAPDFLWIGGSAATASVALAGAAKAGIAARRIVDVWGEADKPLTSGPEADGAYLLKAVTLFGEDVPGMKVIERFSPGAPKPSHYVRGFTAMLVLAEGLSIAQKSGDLRGPALRAALETLRGFDPLGLSPAVTFTPQDHRGVMAALVYRIENGKPRLAALAELPR